MKTISFKCSQCGICCNTVPVLTFPEVFEFQNDFIIIFSLITKVYNLKSKNNQSNKFKNKVNSEEFYFKFNDDYGIKLFMGFEPLDYKNENKCLMLDSNNLCKLHLKNKIPLRCSSVPFAPYLMNKKFFPQMMQDKIQARPYLNNCVSFESDNKENAEILWKNGKFNNKSSLIQSTHRENEAYFKDSKNIYSLIYEIFKENGFKDFHSVLDINNIIKRCNFTTDIDFLYFENFMPLHFIFNNIKYNNIKFYQMLENEYLITYDDILDLYKKQIKLINETILQEMSPDYRKNLSLILNIYERKVNCKIQ